MSTTRDVNTRREDESAGGELELGGGRGVVFYDAECGLCDRVVRLLLRLDRDRALRFASLQGPTAARWLGPERASRLDTFYLLEPGAGVRARSEAALRVGELLGGPWRALARVARALPRRIRDAAYDWVAARRATFFPPPEACSIPPASWRARLLD